METKSWCYLVEKGDRNTRLFYSLVKGRRKKLQITRIKNTDGDSLEDNRIIGDEAMRCFQEKFSQNAEGTNFDMLNYIPTMVSEEENEKLRVDPL